jgi:hypothetical protein
MLKIKNIWKFKATTETLNIDIIVVNRFKNIVKESHFLSEVVKETSRQLLQQKHIWLRNYPLRDTRLEKLMMMIIIAKLMSRTEFYLQSQ